MNQNSPDDVLILQEKETPTDATKPTQPVNSTPTFEETSADIEEQDKEPSMSSIETTDHMETNQYSRASYLHA